MFSLVRTKIVLVVFALFVSVAMLSVTTSAESTAQQALDLKFVSQFCPGAGEALELAKKAEQFVREHGQEVASAEFNKTDSEFSEGDKYVFAFDENAVVVAHRTPELIGKNMTNIKDTDGLPIFKLFTEIETEGWVTYKWPRQKASYIINVDGYYLGTGVFCQG